MQRRDFLARSINYTLASAAFSALPAKLALAQSRAAGPVLRGAGINYKALVCIYLYGGNDAFNMVIPTGSGYGAYNSLRTNLAVPEAQLLALNLNTPAQGGGTFGLHPAMTGMRDLFNSGDAAIIANIGPLVRPITRAQYVAPVQTVPVPPQLFSHSDQTVLWQSPRADSINRIGWGGLLADEFRASNTNQVLSMNVSINGDNVFQAGNQVAPYFVSSQGAERIEAITTGAANCADGPTGWNRKRCVTFNALMNQSDATLNPNAPLFEREYVRKTKSTINTSEQVAAALTTVPANGVAFRAFWDRNDLPWDPNNLAELPQLGQQLLMIARMLYARTTLNMSRQMFFAGMGGFDTHQSQIDDHPALLKDLSQSVKAFYEVLANAPGGSLVNDVTTFTASDFGRTTTNNGRGTDHGWGSHHFVIGGEVNGSRIYGLMPSLLPSTTNPDDAGWGQIIPTLAVDQYAATLCRWYGLPEANIPAFFPNLQYMGSGTPLSISGSNLGFMVV